MSLALLLFSVVLKAELCLSFSLMRFTITSKAQTEQLWVHAQPRPVNIDERLRLSPLWEWDVSWKIIWNLYPSGRGSTALWKQSTAPSVCGILASARSITSPVWMELGGMGLQETWWNSKGYVSGSIKWGQGRSDSGGLTRRSSSFRYAKIWPVQVPWYRWGPAFGWSSASPL